MQGGTSTVASHLLPATFPHLGRNDRAVANADLRRHGCGIVILVRNTFDGTQMTTRLARTLALSGLYGMAAAVVMSRVSVVWGGLLLILSFPLVFRSEERVSLSALFISFAIAWPVVLALGSPIVWDPDALPTTFVSGFVPLALAAATVLVVRSRSRRQVE